MHPETVLLILDSSEEDRRSVRSLFEGTVGRVLEATNPAEAWQLAQGLDHLSAMIAGFAGESGGEVFDLRDHLQGSHGIFPCAFCSRDDMTPFYSRVFKGDRLFFKPVNGSVLLDWFLTTRTESESATATDGNPPPNPPSPEGEAIAAGAPEAATEPSPETAASSSLLESAPVALPEEALPVGTRLGDYKLLREIQRDADFALYEAEQTSIGRHVALKTLYRKHRKDIHWVHGFVNEASARASVNHPAISLVYECDQELGVNFYTLELVDAPSLADLARRRAELDPAVLWKVLTSASSALLYLRDSGMSHRLFTAQSILIVKGSEPRIANPVRGRGLPLSPEDERKQMELLADAILPFLKKAGTDPALYAIIDRMGTDRIDAINTIEGLRKALHPPDPKEGLSQAELAKITEKETDRTALIAGLIIGALIVGAAIIAFLVMGSKPEVRDLETFIKIPAGKFPFQNGPEVEVPEFWMGRHEVTIAEYADFLEDLKAHPDLAARVRHPDQPAEKKSYEPEKWSEYLAAAMKGGTFSGVKIDPNFPVTGVDFWDANAYATWRGGRLPSEQEWEKAARGRSGSVYPWGDTLENKNFNGGLDHEDKEGVAAGSIDGSKYWCPVDAIAADESRYGVIGLAGNVSEWTATWDALPNKPDKRVPLKRGASFATTSGFELISRRAAESASERNYLTGFRIAADRENPVRLSADGSATPPAPAPVSPESEAAPNPAKPETPAAPPAQAEPMTPAMPPAPSAPTSPPPVAAPVSAPAAPQN